MNNVYLWIVGDAVIFHADLEAATQLDGLTAPPDMTIPEEQFYAVGGIARVINGEIVLGKTEQEIAGEATRKRIAGIDARFLEIEQKLIRPVLARVQGAETEEDVERINALTLEIMTLRAERKVLAASVSAAGKI